MRTRTQGEYYRAPCTPCMCTHCFFLPLLDSFTYTYILSGMVLLHTYLQASQLGRKVVLLSVIFSFFRKEYFITDSSMRGFHIGPFCEYVCIKAIPSSMYILLLEKKKNITDCSMTFSLLATSFEYVCSKAIPSSMCCRVSRTR